MPGRGYVTVGLTRSVNTRRIPDLPVRIELRETHGSTYNTGIDSEKRDIT
jgi:hypothetical protein